MKRNFKEVLLDMVMIGQRRFKFLFNLSYKVYYFFSHLLNVFRYGDFYFFNSVNIETSTYCNRKCSYCPNAMYKSPHHLMSKELFQKTLDRLKEVRYTGPIQYHFYNEPLMDKRLPELIRMVRVTLPKCVNRVVTNGDFLTKELAEKFFEAGLSQFILSIHDSGKKKEAFMKKMKPLLDKYPGKIVLSVVSNNMLSTRGGLIKVVKSQMNLKCTETRRGFQIYYNGDVGLCCDDYFRTVTWGNIEKKSLAEIWNQESYKKIRRDLRHGKPRLDICKKCLNPEG